ncbi:DEAD/DEAH box helicase [Rhodopseudomonas palustris]|uniref:DEAD/DEAH box helicase n=1 Tax=Rhodopseudomonas palustris TaxID=1076 RepID=UPI0022F03A32|nr:DEAD/DEAH box helicase [Rhodopseudomonas palustris]WBU31733.1 DEAD/DEAH box helicase [Rhodopseudomonas palustris]
MIQELVEKVWNNPLLQQATQRIETACVARELGLTDLPTLHTPEAAKLMRAAAILACSSHEPHRRAAYRIATFTYEYFGTEQLPLDQALRVVLARLGNFPSLATRNDVNSSFDQLPLSLAIDEMQSSEERTVSVRGARVVLTKFQHDLWTHLKSGSPVVLAAPTSSGKSFVLQSYLSTLFEDDAEHSVVYAVPTRALIAQVANDLEIQLANLRERSPSIVTVPIDSDTTLPRRAIFVMTQERLQLVINSHLDFKVELAVIDEAQSIADGSRGVLLQWVIDDILERNKDTQILFASPTISNLNVFARLFGLRRAAEMSSTEPTVAQNFIMIDVESATKGRISVRAAGDGTEPTNSVGHIELSQTIASRIDKLVHISYALGKDQTNIVYANGAAEAETLALQLSELLCEEKPTEHQLELAALANETVHSTYVLSQCIRRGVAFHYSNMPTQLRKAIEAATSKGEIRFLVCTSTLLQGVNLPVKNIFMCHPEKGRTKPLDSIDFWNLAGRAGRLRREFHGNIFLIDYGGWKKKPLSGPKSAIVVPAIEFSIREREPQLIDVIRGTQRIIRDDPELETTFGRLFHDMKQGALQSTLDRVGFNNRSTQAEALLSALAAAAESVTVPPTILQKTPSISAHKQQRLFDRLLTVLEEGDDAARTLIPKHPRESDSFNSYADILKMCHELLLQIDTTRNLHRFHALISRRWMLGLPLPQIIDEQIKRNRAEGSRTTIRKTLDLIEGTIRFQVVRLFGCYNTLLAYALSIKGQGGLGAGIPSLPLFLELGASDKTMISFISMGLSRVTAMKLNELAARKDMDPDAAREWLRSRPLETLGFSPILISEISSVLK